RCHRTAPALATRAVASVATALRMTFVPDTKSVVSGPAPSIILSTSPTPSITFIAKMTLSSSALLGFELLAHCDGLGLGPGGLIAIGEQRQAERGGQACLIELGVQVGADVAPQPSNGASKKVRVFASP